MATLSGVRWLNPLRVNLSLLSFRFESKDMFWSIRIDFWDWVWVFWCFQVGFGRKWRKSIRCRWFDWKWRGSPFAEDGLAVEAMIGEVRGEKKKIRKRPESVHEGEAGWVFCSHFKFVYFFLDVEVSACKWRTKNSPFWADRIEVTLKGKSLHKSNVEKRTIFYFLN